MPKLLGLPERPQDISSEPSLFVIPTDAAFATPSPYCIQRAGDFIGVISIPSGVSLTFSVDRYENQINNRFPLRSGDRVFLRFHRIYIYTTGVAAGGFIKIFIGGDSYSEFVPFASGAIGIAPPNTAINAEVLVLNSAWTLLLDLSLAQSLAGVVFIYNNGPNTIELSTVNNTTLGKGAPKIVAGGQYVLDNPGGQRWYARAQVADQIAAAATNVMGWYSL